MHSPEILEGRKERMPAPEHWWAFRLLGWVAFVGGVGVVALEFSSPRKPVAAVVGMYVALAGLVLIIVMAVRTARHRIRHGWPSSGRGRGSKSGFGSLLLVVGVVCLLASWANVPDAVDWAGYDLRRSAYAGGPDIPSPPGGLVIPFLVAGGLLFMTGVLVLLLGKRPREED